MKGRQIEVTIQHTEELDQVAIDIYTLDGSPLTGQDLIDAISETILLKYDNYDLDSAPELDS